jgi:hypothetical protein
MPGGHYEPFLGGHEQSAGAELSFLRRHVLNPSQSLPSKLAALPVVADRHQAPGTRPAR